MKKYPKPKPSICQSLLHNQWILYLVILASIMNIMWYLCMNDITRIFIFIISALITQCLTNNMILVFGVPLVLSVFSQFVYVEAFTEEGSTEPQKTKVAPITKPASNTETDIVVPAYETDMTPDTESSPQETGNAGDGSGATETDNYSNRINYADTLVNNIQSYREMLGTDGFAKMTKDTQELLRQQDELGKSIQQFAPIIEKMTPFLTQASGILNKLDVTHLTDITKNIKNIKNM
jgi:hypothetical protein